MSQRLDHIQYIVPNIFLAKFNLTFHQNTVLNNRKLKILNVAHCKRFLVNYKLRSINLDCIIFLDSLPFIVYGVFAD